MSSEPHKIDVLSALLPAFKFEDLIAHGGMGAVYKARQRSLDRDVAIKILPRELGRDPSFRSSFQAEAKAMARLTHPNLIKVYDSGDVDGLLYIVMEYVPGKSLYHSAYGKAIDSKQAVEIVIAVCRGLAHAHECGIVHRDIKPANILLTPKCEPKIGDFGIARCTRTDGNGLPMGTPGYMAPEAIRQPTKGNAQSDVFSIGVVLRELLTGCLPTSAESASHVISDSTLAEICRTATHPDLSVRYADASTLAEELNCWIALNESKVVVTQSWPAVRQVRTAVRQVNPAARHAKPAIRHGNPPMVARPRNSGHRGLLRSCGSIAILLCASYFAWGSYQTRQVTSARLDQELNSKTLELSVSAEPRASARDNSYRDLAMETSLASLIRDGTALAVRNFK